MAVNGSKQSPVSATPPPPRTLNVQKFAESRAAELEALQSIVSNRLNNDFRSRRNKRRRTTSYDNRVTKNRYRKRSIVDLSDDAASEKAVPRRIRRRIELRKNPESGFSTSGDGTKRLRTHVWHAKRFTMTKLWGFHLPLGLQGRGKGSRALLKRFKDGVLIHDASYHSAVQLEGPQNSLLQMLSTVLVPFHSSQSEDISDSVLSGAIYGSAMLHYVGAPFSPAIAPITYMWRPLHRQIEDPSCFRQLWVWIHASAFAEGYDALKFACQKQMDETNFPINCLSLQGKLAKLEVMGPKAFQLLQKILHPVTSIVENSGQLGECLDMESDKETCLKKFSVFENEHHILSSAIMSLNVSDPRGLPDKKVELVVHRETSAHTLGTTREDDAEKLHGSVLIPHRNTELLSSSLSKHEEDSALSDNVDLWDATKGIHPPMEENVLCMEKHHQRLSSFCLGNANLGKQNTSSGELFCRSCHILLLNSSNKKSSLIRWSIILPLSWIKVFWVPFVSGGAHVIGLREKQWCASEVGLPHFPSEFPDCNAYSCFMATNATTSDEKEKLRPPSMRPTRVPVPPPWESIKFSVEKKSSRVEDAQTHYEESSAITNLNEFSLTNSDCGKSDMVALSHHGSLNDGIVARTSTMLSHFLREIHGDRLLLFPHSPDINQTKLSLKSHHMRSPHSPDMKNNIVEFMKDNSRFSQAQDGITTLIKNDRQLCFLRVTLHAHKRGVFEEGAVVCAPHISDTTSWTSRSDNNKEELQIPQSSVRSYFEQQPSGKWQLQIPKDPVAMESYRWPIGFVTTGFVRGSKRPTAGAICEATLLANLREEQWNAMPVKRRRKEIYVLVRNLRSSAYRLALATIVLEQQEEDLVFM